MKSPRVDARRTALLPQVPSSSVEAPPNDPDIRRIAQDGLWTVKELARYLSMSERWVHERTRRDEIPCYRLGTALRFDPQEVHGWMIQRRESPVGGRGAA
jgi:excisionase family DNA binding protein